MPNTKPAAVTTKSKITCGARCAVCERKWCTYTATVKTAFTTTRITGKLPCHCEADRITREQVLAAAPVAVREWNANRDAW